MGAFALATLVALANAGGLPSGHTPMSVAKLLARESHGRGGRPAVGMAPEGVALFSTDAIPLEGGKLKALPEWIELIPAPLPDADEGHVETRDWRKGFKVDPYEIVEKFNAKPKHRRASPIDYEHKGHRNWDSERNPAAAWIEELKVGDDGKSVWGRVVWTDIGSDDIRNLRYRYISPVVAILWPADSEGRIDWDSVPEATDLVDAALTNNPATFIRDLARTSDEESDESENSMGGSGALAASFDVPPTPPGRGEQDYIMLSKEALTALGLDEKATPEQINAAVLAASKATRTAATATSGGTVAAEEFSVALDAAKAEIEATFKAELGKRDAEIAELRESKSESDARAKATQVDVVLSEMASEMRFAPAERTELVTLGAEIGPERLRSLLSKRPSLSHLSEEAGKGARTQTDPKALTKVELETAEQLGVSPDEFRKSKKVLASDRGRFSAGFVSLSVAPANDEDDTEAA